MFSDQMNWRKLSPKTSAEVGPIDAAYMRHICFCTWACVKNCPLSLLVYADDFGIMKLRSGDGNVGRYSAIRHKLAAYPTAPMYALTRLMVLVEIIGNRTVFLNHTNSFIIHPIY